MLKRFLKAAQESGAKQLYQDFRFWNENLCNARSTAKELAHEGQVVQEWDFDGVVVQAGKICGSMTLMQGLAMPEDKMVDTLHKTMKGLAVLGRGLMEGHSVVLARVNAVLVADAATKATSAQGTAPQIAAAGPAAKKAKMRPK